MARFLAPPQLRFVIEAKDPADLRGAAAKNPAESFWHLLVGRPRQGDWEDNTEVHFTEKYGLLFEDFAGVKVRLGCRV